MNLLKLLLKVGRLKYTSNSVQQQRVHGVFINYALPKRQDRTYPCFEETLEDHTSNTARKCRREDTKIRECKDTENIARLSEFFNENDQSDTYVPSDSLDVFI